MSWQCFMLEPTLRGRRALRRFTWSSETQCPVYPNWGHDASTPIEDGDMHRNPAGYFDCDDKNVPHDDPRWPTQCACGYQFADSDQWQVSVNQIYRAEDGREFTIHPSRADQAPAGAMWRSEWLEPHMAGPDGISLTMVLPDGHHWTIDGPSTSGGGWTRTGTPPMITVRPSILTPHYHGWLTDGVLSDDLDGTLAVYLAGKT